MITPSPAPVENGEEYFEMVDVRLRPAPTFEDLAADSYSIVTAKLLGVTQDEKFFSKRYYDFEIEECIKGDADNLLSVTLEVNDFAFGETSTFIVNKEDGYIPPYEIGARYLLFLGKRQNAIARENATKYFLNYNAFSLIDGEEITELMQQAHPYDGEYPETMSLLKEKIAEIIENPSENGKILGCEFIDSDDISETVDFAQVIIEVRKENIAGVDNCENWDDYHMELVKIHKGEPVKSPEILANDNALENPGQYLLFLMPMESGSGSYLPASLNGSVIPLSDTEKYNEAIKCIYQDETKQGLLSGIINFIKKLFKSKGEN